jgi:hypothetical protein
VFDVCKRDAFNADDHVFVIRFDAGANGNAHERTALARRMLDDSARVVF